MCTNVNSEVDLKKFLPVQQPAGNLTRRGIPHLWGRGLYLLYSTLQSNYFMFDGNRDSSEDRRFSKYHMKCTLLEVSEYRLTGDAQMVTYIYTLRI